MKANSDKSKQSNKSTRRVLAGVLCGASVLSLVLSLVMPPISQAIANDAQTVSAEETVMGGGSSTESTDVENTNNGDTENQNSDDAENSASEDAAAAGLPSDDTKVEGDTQPSDAQPADDGANGEGAISLAANNESTYTISSGAELSAKLLDKKLRDASGSAIFELVNDIECNQEIRFEQTDDNPINITLNLNGHKIKCLNTDKPLFDVANGATLTIKDEIKDSAPVTETVNDVQQLTDQEQKLNPDNYGKKAVLNYVDGIPSNLTYYVTKSTPSGTGTIETLVSHNVDIKGAIVACGGNANLKLINLYNNNGKGGTFNLVSGVITQKQDGSVSSLVYAENGSTVNMSGGYVCGASSLRAGGGIEICNNSSLNISGGVIAGNSAYSGGGVHANASTVTITNGVISGNSTLDSAGFGGGIMAEYGGSVTVSGGYITNNRYAKFCGKDGDGCHGGAGLAAIKGADVAIYGGQITGNYSDEAGGGVYVTNIGQQDMAWLKVTGGIIASNVSYRSEGAGIRVGQKVDAFINGPKESNGTKKSIVYITNNHCMSRFDWGGGGIFVQGDSKNATNAGRLFVYNSYISSNTAGGYGGGVAVCPSGKTLVTNTEGTAIFGNKSAGNEFPSKDHPNPAYKQEGNSGNDKAPHLSAGNDSKDQDKAAYLKDVFRDNGHADFFLAAHDHKTPIAVVTGEMLGGGDAQYSGSIELEKAINIPANGAVGVKNSIGLTSGVMSGVTVGDKAAIQARDAAQNEATTFITGNYSWDHGGGIMSNGDLYLGVPADAYVYPSLKLKATKALKNQQTKESMTLDTGQFPFSFSVYRKDSNGASTPSWDGETFNSGGCKQVVSAPNNADGNITFDLSNDLSNELSKQSLASDTGKIRYSYYLVEDAGNIPGVDYDHAVYEINVTVEYNKTVLMSVPMQGETDKFNNLNVYNYTIDSVDVTKNPEGSAVSLGSVSPTDDYYLIAGSGKGSTFTNKYIPSVSWTPKATKVVEGGEMKAFTLQLVKDSCFSDEGIIGTAVTSGNENKQTHSFLDGNGKEIELTYSLSDIRDSPDPGDSTGGPSKTFKYYVCEKDERSTYPHYKFDQSVYELTVVAKVDDAGITTNVTYTKIVDAEGKIIPEDKRVKKRYGEDANAGQSLPTFTNTYSTSLPLSGMSGVTLTYLAGAAVLCAAAAWMHIRRKANAKGGKRRE